MRLPATVARRRVRAAGLALGGLFVAYVAVLAFGPDTEFLSLYVEPSLFNLLLAGGATACTVRAAGTDADRLAWALIAAGLWFWTIGDVWYSFGGGRLPVITDVAFVAFYAIGVAGLWRLCGWHAAQRRSALLWLDPLTGALAVGALWWALMQESMHQAVSGEGMSAVLAVAYPLGDLFFLVLMVMCVTDWSRKRSRALPLLAAGFSLVAFADVVYAWQSTAGGYFSGTLLDPLWPAGVLLIAVAAWQPVSSAPEASPRFQQVAPAVATAVAVAILSLFEAWNLPFESFLLALAATFAAILRSLGTSASYLRMLQVAELSGTRLAEANRIARFGQWELDVEAQTVSATDELYRLLGWAPGEAPDRHDGLMTRVHPDDHALVEEAFAQALLDHLPFAYDVRVLPGDGREITVRIQGQVDSEGGRIYGSGHDITERLEGERAVRQAEELFRRAFDGAPVGMSLSAPDGAWLRVNKAYLDMFGYSAEELADMSFRDITVPDDLPAHEEFMAAALRGEVDSTTLEKRYLHRDGHELKVRINVSLIRDERGRPGYFISQLENVTERERGREALERLAALVEASEDAILSTNVDGQVTSWNPAAARLFGSPAEQAVGSQLEELLGDGLTGYTLGSTLELDRVSRQEFSWNDPDGTERQLSLVASPIRSGESEVVGLSCVIHDITARVSSERARMDLELKLRQTDKLESVGRLAGGIAHDFNNLLAVILNYADFLLDAATDDDTRRDLTELRTAAERGAQLTRQLLLFTRRGVSQPDILELDEHIRKLQPLLSRAIGEDVDLCCKLATGHNCVRLDPSELDQIVMNLAVNARQAMLEGGAITVSTELFENVLGDPSEDHGLPAGMHLAITVSDTGSGMPPDVLDRALEPFFTTKDAGTGLGLATVFGAATSAGGSVSIRTEEGSGTEITVRLPIAEAAERTIDLPDGGETPQPPAAGISVLVVEDDGPVRDAAQRILTKQGYSVETAAGPTEAIELARLRQPVIVLTDVVMPRMPGTVLVGLLRQFLPDLRVVYMSGYNEDVVLRAGVRSGDVTFVQKPFDARQLAEAIGAAFADGSPVTA